MDKPTIIDLLGVIQQMGASDLFLAEDRVPSARINGIIRRLKREEISKEELSQFLTEILNQKQEEQFRQNGDLDIGYTNKPGQRFRINIALQQGKVSIVARCLPAGNMTFGALNLPEQLKGFTQHQSGIVLVTGATGSGKSTTLAALINEINQNQRLHVVTIEDPIEFVHLDVRSRISQREIGSDTRSFQEALRRVVRQSPDVILIGEMRDKETISVAMSAALTGHLVFSTVHTIDAAQTLQRIISYFPEHLRAQIALDLSLSLRGIISQRLVPTKDERRVLAMELLTNTPAVSQLLRERNYSDLEDLMRGSRSEDIYTFNQSLLRYYKQGVIEKEVAFAYSTNPDELGLMMQGMTTGTQSKREQGGGEDIPDMKKLLQLVVSRGASDLHLTVGRPPILRVNGELKPGLEQRLNDTDMRMLLNSIMNARQRTIYEIDKEVDFALSLDKGQRFRVNAYFQRGRMAAAFRAIPSEIPDPTQMRIPEQVMKFADKPHGLVLVVGPTGSGKSTTLACLIDRINKTRRCRILTIEDPIEFHHTGLLATIDQREVYSDTKSFAAALKYILRQDPDVILVGEMRDQETISAALTAAETGHLVFATLHTNDAVQTIDRIIDVFPSHQQDQVRSQLAASLQAVVSQRLLQSKENSKRVAAFEIMIGNHAICNMIRDNKMHQALGMMEASKSAGMVTMDSYLKSLYQDGMVSEDEALRYALNPKYVLG